VLFAPSWISSSGHIWVRKSPKNEYFPSLSLKINLPLYSNGLYTYIPAEIKCAFNPKGPGEDGDGSRFKIVLNVPEYPDSSGIV
jgi:hypothetical protein